MHDGKVRPAGGFGRRNKDAATLLLLILGIPLFCLSEANAVGSDVTQLPTRLFTYMHSSKEPYWEPHHVTA